MNVSDLDQAYEQCDGAKVGVSWYHLASYMTSKFDSSKVLVRKGKKVQSTYPASSPYGRGWLALSFDQLGKALTVLGRMTLVVLSGVVFEMKGCPIGGIASAACLSASLGAEDLAFDHGSPELHAQCGRMGSFFP